MISDRQKIPVKTASIGTSFCKTPCVPICASPAHQVQKYQPPCNRLTGATVCDKKAETPPVPSMRGIIGRIRITTPDGASYFNALANSSID